MALKVLIEFRINQWYDAVLPFQPLVPEMELDCSCTSCSPLGMEFDRNHITLSLYKDVKRVHLGTCGYM